jgi:hypothetical protein
VRSGVVTTFRTTDGESIGKARAFAEAAPAFHRALHLLEQTDEPSVALVQDRLASLAKVEWRMDVPTSPN